MSQRMFEYKWDGGENNLKELNALIEEDYSVGAVFDCSNNTFERGKIVLVLNKNEETPDTWGMDEDEEEVD